MEKILEAKKIRGRTKLLVKWTGYADPTWEPLSNFVDTETLDRFEAENGKVSL